MRSKIGVDKLDKPLSSLGMRARAQRSDVQLNDLILVGPLLALIRNDPHAEEFFPESALTMDGRVGQIRHNGKYEG
jgi:hypothetical protein